ncbi:MAG: GAF domain-containing protein [Anaerolineales bacterium]|nr:MAG: GAF domain-containing protein [Anaerolineales bacterium]
MVNRRQKTATYERVMQEIEATLDGETDLLAAMVTVTCLLHQAFDSYFWTGFYRRVGAEQLLIGPYQGTLGCLHITFDRGVCGACARGQQTIIVPDVHQFPGHIACDPHSKSEIVVPVFDRAGQLIAVFDVDSDQYNAFDEVDQQFLERIMAWLACFDPSPVVLATSTH